MTGWYYAKSGKRLGPFTLAQMEQLAKSGMMNVTDMVLPDGENEWVTVESALARLLPTPLSCPDAHASHHASTADSVADNLAGAGLNEPINRRSNCAAKPETVLESHRGLTRGRHIMAGAAMHLWKLVTALVAVLIMFAIGFLLSAWKPPVKLDVKTRVVGPGLRLPSITTRTLTVSNNSSTALSDVVVTRHQGSGGLGIGAGRSRGGLGGVGSWSCTIPVLKPGATVELDRTAGWDVGLLEEGDTVEVEVLGYFSRIQYKVQ